jgi:hypothetical protein
MTTVIILCLPEEAEAVAATIERWLKLKNHSMELVGRGASEKQGSGVILLECDGEPPLWLAGKLKLHKSVIDYVQYDLSVEEEEEE